MVELHVRLAARRLIVSRHGSFIPTDSVWSGTAIESGSVGRSAVRLESITATVLSYKH